MGAPEVAHMGEEQGAHLVDTFGIEEAREIEPLLVVEHGELGNADVGEVLWAEPEELPRAARNGGEGELVAQETVFLLQADIIVIRRGSERCVC